jgi:hypothetical protein
MAGFTRYLELSFWKISIALLGSKKAMSMVIIFSCCLIIFLLVFASFLTYNLITASRFSVPVVHSQHIHSSQVAESAQINTLIILADQLDQGEPQLRGVWLAVFQVSKSQLIFLPVYPSLSHVEGIETKSLAEYFHVDVNGIPTKEFFNNIGQNNLWWDHVLVLDSHALDILMEMTDGLNLGNGKLTGSSALSEFTLGQVDPQAAQITQAILLRGLCQEANTIIQTVFPSEEFYANSNHWYSDFNPINLGANLNEDNHLRGLSCEVPVLTDVSLYINEDK